jgi:hypothetical protein
MLDLMGAQAGDYRGAESLLIASVYYLSKNICQTPAVGDGVLKPRHGRGMLPVSWASGEPDLIWRSGSVGVDGLRWL